PKKSADQLAKVIDNPDQLINLKMERKHVEFSLPKFEHRKRVDLVSTMRKMGIREVFTRQANLKMISDPRDPREQLNVSKIIHEAVVKVDEEGTEAAAATAILMVKEMAMR